MSADGPPLAAWSLLTPSAPGPLAVIEITGDVDRAMDAFGTAGVRVGEVRLRDIAGVDRGLVARWGDSCAYLMPHGGRAVVEAIVARLGEAGLEPAAGPAWPEAADELEGRMLDALAHAASPLAIDLLLDQPRRWRESGAAADEAHSSILDRLIRPPLVVATGASNIGKSTLVNALAGRGVSVVADEPGTTRDHVGVEIDAAGLVVRYVDTPGRIDDAGPIDREAARIAGAMGASADLLLLCGDATAAPEPAPGGHAGASLTVALRTDLGEPDFAHDVGVCAAGGTGLDALARAIREALVPGWALADPRPWRFWPAAAGEGDRTER